MTFTHSTTLPVGIYHDGVLHREVTVRLATVGDEIAVIEAGIPESGTVVGILARCMTQLGTLAPEEITYQLLCDTLVQEDYAALHTAQLEAKKKAQRAEARLRAYRFALVRLGQYGISAAHARCLDAVALGGLLDAIGRLENPKGWRKSRTIKSLPRRPPSAKRT
ncbi:MAG: hypothetical protein ACMX3H_16955 [Sodalis sp. (in: enterobacteria)]|uniref:hypothetical protein n=1 Tax=Sodalis sp. (in: enterobacteria) TaxID=1898979 RepID=UPI0039E5B06D